MKNILLSLLLVLSSTAVVAQEVTKQDVILLAENTSVSSQVLDPVSEFLGSTVKLISTPIISAKDVECLARNIFYEAGGESEEGKVAVAMVTINRANDPRFGRSICEVVKARTVVVRTREVNRTEIVQTGHFGRPEPVTKRVQVMDQVPVCQFSWVCAFVRKPTADDERWIQSQEIAQAVVRGDYDNYRNKYGQALFFHSAGIRPVWAKSRPYITRTGGHIFYE